MCSAARQLTPRSAYWADALIGSLLRCQAAALAHDRHSARIAQPLTLTRAQRQTRSSRGAHLPRSAPAAPGTRRAAPRPSTGAAPARRARLQSCGAHLFRSTPAHARCGACQARSAATPCASSGGTGRSRTRTRPHTADARAAQSACLRRAARRTAGCSGAPAPSEQARLRDRVARGAAGRACAWGCRRARLLHLQRALVQHVAGDALPCQVRRVLHSQALTAGGHRGLVDAHPALARAVLAQAQRAERVAGKPHGAELPGPGGGRRTRGV